MKKLLLSLLLGSASLSLFAGNIYDPIEPPNNTSLTKTTGKDITDGGFFVHLTGNIPSLNYGNPQGLDNTDSEFKFGFGGGLELGNLFKITDVSQHAFGVKAVWLSSMFSSMTLDDTTSIIALQASVLRVGPYFSLGINDNMAIDLYYTVGTSILIFANDGEGEALGMTHNVGVAYRMSVLSVGMDFNFGKVKDTDCFGENSDFGSFAGIDFCKIRTTHIRMFVGVKI